VVVARPQPFFWQGVRLPWDVYFGILKSSSHTHRHAFQLYEFLGNKRTKNVQVQVKFSNSGIRIILPQESCTHKKLGFNLLPKPRIFVCAILCFIKSVRDGYDAGIPFGFPQLPKKWLETKKTLMVSCNTICGIDRRKNKSYTCVCLGGGGRIPATFFFGNNF